MLRLILNSNKRAPGPHGRPDQLVQVSGSTSSSRNERWPYFSCIMTFSRRVTRDLSQLVMFAHAVVEWINTSRGVLAVASLLGLILSSRHPPLMPLQQLINDQLFDFHFA